MNEAVHDVSFARLSIVGCRVAWELSHLPGYIAGMEYETPEAAQRFSLRAEYDARSQRPVSYFDSWVDAWEWLVAG